MNNIKKFKFIGRAAMLGLVSGSAFAGSNINAGFDAAVGPFAVGQTVNVTGSAGAGGVTGGTGLDVALVLDSSGSMGSGGRQQAQKDAANALVSSLSTGSSVAVIEYDSDANIVTGLTPLTTGLATITNAINATDAGGGTDIRDGIVAGEQELLTVNAFPGDPDPSRSQVMIVLSDGGSNSSLAHNAALNAIANGTEQVHSVGISSSHNAAVMQNIVSGTDGVYNTGDDIGIYTDGSDLSNLVSIFSGGGTLVGLDRVEITLPDGTVLNSDAGDFSLGALGNFALDYTLALGSNVFTALATATDGATATASINYQTAAGTGGTTPTNPSVVPLPGAFWLFGTALLGLVGVKRKKS